MSQVITAGTAESVGERVRSIRWGILALVVACAVAVFGAYGDPHPQANQEDAVPYICAVAAILAIGIFGFLVPAGLRGAANRPGLWSGWALALGILGVVIIPVTFWSGVPLLVGTAAVLLGAAGRQAATAAGRGRGVPSWALGLGAFAIVAGLAIAIVGTVVVPD
jgi:hypothetical protein